MYNNRLKEARLQRGLTQEDVAKRIGVFKTTVSGYETGRSEPCMLHLTKLMEIYGVDANWLFQDEMASIRLAKENTSLTPSEAELLGLYRQLNEQGQALALSTIRAMAGNPAMKEDAISSEFRITCPFSKNPCISRHFC